MNTYTIELTNAEKAAMEYITYEPQDWVENAMKERARLAIEDIVKLAIEKYLELSISIPSSKDEIVIDAYERGWIQTAKYKTDNYTPSL
jgi:hypothetical protein